MRRKKLLPVLCLLLLGLCQPMNAIDHASLVSYASSLKGKKGADLKEALEALMKNKTVLSYGKGAGHTWSGFYKTDRNKETNECYNRYSSKKFYFTSATNAIDGMNIEHSFPKSWWGGASNDAYKDLYNLYPSDKSANSSKSNFPMDEVTKATSGEEGYDKVGTGTHTSNAWEPGDQFKGDFSRGYMYMAVTYGGLTFSGIGLQTMTNEAYPGLKSWASTLYRTWSKKDKVSDLERDRNNAVSEIQGNRNLFIDYPFLAEYVWGDSTDVPFNPSTSISTASDDDRYMNVNPDNPDTPTYDDVYYFSKATTITSGKQYVLAAQQGDTLFIMKPLASNKTYGYPYVDKFTTTTDTLTQKNFDNAYILTESGNGYTITDSKARYLFHEGTYKTLSVSNNSDKAAVWTITKNADGTFKIETDGYYLQYSTIYKSYGCYNNIQGIMPILFELTDKAATSINSVTTVKANNDNRIFTIQGQYVGKDLNTLPRGLYISNGKKIIIR